MDINAIILQIQSLPLKEALAFLAANKIYNLSGKSYSHLKKIITTKASKKKYGFVPNKNESTYLGRVRERVYYNEFIRLLPKHRYSDLIRTGYLISHLNKTGGRTNRTRVKNIRESICLMPNGAHNIKIVNLVTTGAIVPLMNYLDRLKKQNYDNDYILNYFDEFIINWKKITYFVQNKEKILSIYNQIKQKIKTQERIIMIFSYGSAKTNTTKAVAKILNEGSHEGYLYDSKNVTEGDKEVHASTFSLID
jgi:hypothetical protein